jgi:hypothetical protein
MCGDFLFSNHNKSQLLFFKQGCGIMTTMTSKTNNGGGKAPTPPKKAGGGGGVGKEPPPKKVVVRERRPGDPRCTQCGNTNPFDFKMKVRGGGWYMLCNPCREDNFQVYRRKHSEEDSGNDSPEPYGR